MRKFSFLFVLLCAGLVSCVEDDVLDTQKGDPDLVITEPGNGNVEVGDAVIDGRIFSVINLDYPGLENVKMHYEAAQALTEETDVNAEYYKAVVELIRYYRNRTGIIHPDVQILSPTIGAGEQRTADQALENRLYVRNYAEEGTAGGEDAVYYDLTSAAGNESAIDWWFAPAGANQEYQYQLNRLQFALPLAKAYAVSKDEKYVEKYVFLYNDWLDTFDKPEFVDEPLKLLQDKKYQWYGLQSSERAIDFMQIFFYIIKSESLTPEAFSKFMVAFDTTIECVIKHPVEEVTSNIRLSQSQTIFNAGVLMPEFANAEKWINDGAGKMNEQIGLQFLEDGIQNEFDISYHMGAIGDFLSVYNVAKMNNRLDKLPSDYVNTLHNACTFMASIIYPDYTCERFNETRISSKSVLLRNFRNYLALFPEDEALKYMATEGRLGVEPAEPVVTFPNGGYYILQNGRKVSSTMLILKNNANADNKWHCQPDNGTIAIYRNGRSFLPDAGVSSYGGTSSQNQLRNAYAASIQHNTITKNKKDFDTAHRDGKFLKAETGQGYSLVVTENRSYDDLTHRRAVFMVNSEFFVVVDEAYGEAAAPVWINYSLCADTAKNGKGAAIVEIDDASDEHIYGAHTIYGDGNDMAFKTFSDITDGWSGENSTCYYCTNILTNYPDDKGIQRKRYQVKVDKPADKAARFITVIVPMNKEVPAMSAEFSDNKSGEEGTFHSEGTSVKVTLDGRVYNLSYTL